jgi:hypothetical protein
MKSFMKFVPLLLTLFSVLILSNCDKEELAPLATLNAKIDVSGISFVTDLSSIDGRRIKAGESIALADGSEGAPDVWEWTFSDGTPTKTTENITASWPDPVGQVTIKLTITRTADGATDTDEVVIQVGPVEIMDRGVYGFEPRANLVPVDKWYLWTPNDGTVTKSLQTNDGANGTSHSIKLTAASNYGEFQLRTHENAPEFLVSLKSNTTYIFSFYMKGNQAFTLSEVSVLNVKNDDPKEGWYTPLWTGDSAIEPPSVTTSWKKFTYEFTTADISTFADVGYADGIANNTGPFFKHFGSITGSDLVVWIDEISLKEKDL